MKITTQSSQTAAGPEETAALTQQESVRIEAEDRGLIASMPAVQLDRVRTSHRIWAAPDDCVDAVGVLPEGGQRGGAVQIPQLDGVVPAAAQQQAALGQVPVQAVHLGSIMTVTHAQSAAYLQARLDTWAAVSSEYI